jgi:hypothetical protein
MRFKFVDELLHEATAAYRGQTLLRMFVDFNIGLCVAAKLH